VTYSGNSHCQISHVGKYHFPGPVERSVTMSSTLYVAVSVAT